ncbi:MAG: LPS export ABC transporter periplasmic protein LptC [Cytophagales bacterium]|nr:LPS export ABC transporter periplasmic protein LptC [Cytophagales bacterium]
MEHSEPKQPLNKQIMHRTSFYLVRAFLGLFLSFMLFACTERNRKKLPPAYEGPVMVVKNMDLLRSENGRIVGRARAKTELTFANNDKAYPDGIMIEEWDTLGNVKTIISADSAYLDQKKKLYHAVGDVRVDNKEQGLLETEELFWDRKKKRIYNGILFTLTTKESKLLAYELDASEDLSDAEYLDQIEKIDFDEESLEEKDSTMEKPVPSFQGKQE